MRQLLSSCDILIVGAGVVGSCIARELSRYEVCVAVVEKETDVPSGTSKANSGVIHCGINSPVGSLKAKTCVEGNRLLPKLAEELGVPYRITGKLVIAKSDSEFEDLEKLKSVGEKNGTPALRIINSEELRQLEPNIRGEGALLAQTTGIVCPYTLTIALAENAVTNGVRFFLETQVTGIRIQSGSFRVETNRGEIDARYIVNAAGLHCDEIAGMVGFNRYRVTPCRGEYHVLDKDYSGLVSRPVYPVPPKDGSNVLGVHFTPTIDGNILIGPSAEFIEDKEDLSTTRYTMKQLIDESIQLCPSFPRHGIIKSFAGIRCKLVDSEKPGPVDFIIEEMPEGFINLLGIESPGMTAAPVLASMVIDMIKRHIELRLKDNFQAHWKGVMRTAHLTLEERAALIEKNPNYGEIICRCEHVSRQEILDSLDNPLGARSLASVKYRSRAMMGRCQGGFCGPRITQIIEERFKLRPTDLTLRGGRSYIFTGTAKRDTGDA
jgi:glycerol-3-phosphate dehydrogenase